LERGERRLCSEEDNGEESVVGEDSSRQNPKSTISKDYKYPESRQKCFIRMTEWRYVIKFSADERRTRIEIH
jgi:hypothetical protein